MICVVVSHCDLLRIILMSNDNVNLIICLFFIWCNVCSNILSIFSVLLFIIEFWICCNFLLVCEAYLSSSFEEQKFIILVKSYLFIYLLYCGFSVIPKNSLLNLDLQRFSPMFSSRTFVVWGFKFRSMIRFDLKKYVYPIFPGLFTEKTTFSTELPLQLLKKQLSLCVWVYF